MSEWQPIESAPKDGTIVDLWSGGVIPSCRWMVPELNPFSAKAWCSEGFHFAHGSVYWMPVDEPSQWMPLPEPPK